MGFKNQALIKLVLSTLLFLCLLDMTYGFYQLVRFIALIGFSLLAYQAYKEERRLGTMIFIGLALLFQPLFKIALGRNLWNVVDVLVGVGLVVSILFDSKKDTLE